MTEEQQAVQKEKELIVSELSRLLDRPAGKLYGLAGKLRKEYGAALTVETFAKMWTGRPLSYYLGALRKEAENHIDLGITFKS